MSGQRAADLVVRPVARGQLRELSGGHQHVATTPNSAAYCCAAYLGGKVAGLAAWGWGIVPAQTCRNLFGGELDVRGYLELCRFWTAPWAPPNTASRFLSVTHKLIRRHLPHVKVLYTYAAGFRGLVGYMYQAAGYAHVGTQECNAFLLVPSVGLVHQVALWHRYGLSSQDAARWQGVFPGSRSWHGLNFRYLTYLCGGAERERLEAAARFQVVRPYPKDADLRIWTVDAAGDRQEVDPAEARKVKIVRLPSRRATSQHAAAPSGERATSPPGRCDSDPAAPPGR